MPPWRSRQRRAGHYRVSYEIGDQARLVTVLHVRHRKDMYRNKSSEPGGTLR
jgi:mRNA-degrading endonuclease RelE of RelBE toxin-antitoxin system